MSACFFFGWAGGLVAHKILETALAQSKFDFGTWTQACQNLSFYVMSLVSFSALIFTQSAALSSDEKQGQRLVTWVLLEKAAQSLFEH